ncbi:hypothetical protein GCM10023065_30260 [Microbacterium laevaniformans]|uniref:hypothetical protein n=1 Tax=Microbacterium TaxID=33882 RepID=UPI000452B0FF|nr:MULTISPECIES: hypothetical protein [Microbacterium]EXJ52608.1 hypothetical protein AS96_03425 [Microbacterium sp. MRS-1]MBM7753681.1 hypothetical protein [Microbacterium laevaniformans]GLJ64237.1 hypothetical protein GCM10017578_11250 [Microbacterium laevaniformans]
MNEHRPMRPERRPSYEPVTRLLQPVARDPKMPRPSTTVAGAALVLLSAVVGIASMVELGLNWHSYASQLVLDLDGVDVTPDLADASLAVLLAVVGVGVAIQLVCAILLFLGSNLARVVVMSVATLSIATTFASWWARDQEITLFTTLPTLALDILVLLALSSRSAAAYARRNEKR